VKKFPVGKIKLDTVQRKLQGVTNLNTIHNTCNAGDENFKFILLAIKHKYGSSGLYGGYSNGVPPIHFYQAEHRTQFRSCPMRFLGSSNHENGAPRQEISN
jgi:hypothetical protein